MREIAQADRAKQLVDGSLIRQHPSPGDACRGSRDDSRKEQADLREASCALGFHVLDEHCGDQTEDDRDDGEEDDEIEGMQNRSVQVGIGEDRLVVAQTDECAFVDSIPVVEGIPNGLNDGPEFEDRVEQQSRQQEQQADQPQ